jgi:drug/metabolite transporter (DMT)-like permease
MESGRKFNLYCISNLIVKTRIAGFVGSHPYPRDLLVLAANIFASIGYVAGGRLQRSGYSAKGTTIWGVSIFAVLLIPLLPFSLHIPELKTATVNAWFAVLYLAVGVTIVGYVFWYWLWDPVGLPGWGCCNSCNRYRG